MPEWMIKNLEKIKQYSGESHNSIIRLATTNYIEAYKQNNKISL